MNIYNRILIIFYLLVALASCSSLELSPINGSMDSGTYTSPNKEFKVMIPNYERPLPIRIHEFSDGATIGVLVSTDYFDPTIYRAYLIRSPLPHKKNKRVEFAKKYIDREVNARKQDFSKIEFAEFTVNGHEAYYAVYKDSFYEDSGTYLTLSLINNKDSFYVIEADIFDKSPTNGITSQSQLVRRQWDLFNLLVKSFTVMNSKYNEQTITNKQTGQ